MQFHDRIECLILGNGNKWWVRGQAVGSLALEGTPLQANKEAFRQAATKGPRSGALGTKWLTAVLWMRLRPLCEQKAKPSYLSFGDIILSVASYAIPRSLSCKSLPTNSKDDCLLLLAPYRWDAGAEMACDQQVLQTAWMACEKSSDIAEGRSYPLASVVCIEGVPSSSASDPQASHSVNAGSSGSRPAREPSYEVGLAWTAAERLINVRRPMIDVSDLAGAAKRSRPSV
jgi:hypothetical protein